MRQVRTIRYKDIAADLRRRLEAGEHTAGRLLPSESELSGSYSASRVTIRKALEDLRAEGLVDSRQGFGWFVAEAPVRQPLARLATIEGQLEAEGRRSERRITEFAFVPAPPEIRAVLGVDEVLSVRRVNLADGEPFARVTVWSSPITPADAWKPGPGDDPIVAILGLLVFTIGLPYLVLSSTGPLVQNWFGRCFPGRSPYRLYALSNLGSLLGLLSYPFLLEPQLPLAGQGWVWSLLFVVFVVACAGCAIAVGKTEPLPDIGPAGTVAATRAMASSSP